MPPVCTWAVFGRDCSLKARALPRPSHCHPGMSPQNSAQAPACLGLPGISTQVIHLKSPTGCSQCYPHYEDVVIFATNLESFFCCRTIRNSRQMQTDNTIFLGECNSSTELLIPATSNTAWESTREVRGNTSTHHLFSEECLKLRIPKEWLGRRNKIRFPIKFANVEHLQQFLPGAAPQPCTKITQSSCLNPAVSRKPEKSECTMPNSVYNAPLILNLSLYSSLYKKSRGIPFFFIIITNRDLKSKAVIKLFTHD